MAEKTDCAYCAFVEGGADNFKGRNIGNRILFESKNFVVFPTIGQIVEGYLLIAPKKHFISIAAIPKSMFSELEKLQKKVRAVLEENYSTPLFFEHGPVSETKKGSCCITHAHLHAVPIELDIVRELEKKFKPKKILSLAELKKNFWKKKPYFFVETNSKERFAFSVPEIAPSQYIRRIIAIRTGNPEKWDWHTAPEIDRFFRTCQKLKNKFK
ncbi:MAG TPA: hypothetical protein VI977_02215 [archaeon]|nr:hypothetical protein [archaeon]